MTCIIGIEHKGRVWMGADSVCTNGYTNDAIAEPKIFQRGEFLIGYTTSFRMGQLLQYSLPMKKHKRRLSDMEFMVTVFVESTRALFKDKGFLTTEKGVDEGGNYLIGYRGKLYLMQNDFSIIQTQRHYDACGAGVYHALAAMDALTHVEKPKKRIRMALEIAANRVATVMAPFKIMSIKSNS